MTKLQITLTDQEVSLLAQKAMALGYDITKYAKFVLAREAEDVLKSIPTFRANSNMDKLIKKAVDEDNNGLTQEWVVGKV